MPRYFTVFWSDTYCEERYRAGVSGEALSHLAGEGFAAAGIAGGDVVYVISAYDGQFLLVARLVVEHVLDSYEAAQNLSEEDVEIASEYLIPQVGTATPQYFTRQLRWEEVGDLRLLSGDGTPKPLKFAGDEAIDEEAVHGVREVSESSAMLFDEAISMPFHEHPADAHDHDGGGEEEEEEIDDEDLAAIALSFADEDVNTRTRSVARDFVISAFEERGWTVMPVHDIGEGFDLHCILGDDHLHVVVKGTPHDTLEFTLTELEYVRAERDEHFALCLVTGALSGKPALSTFNGDDLYDLFDARPLHWAFRYR
ncbi:MAG: hypothetical protein RRA94_11435, partial [Bacteroidota bacterium]|nr:hypothetical protein [Bacteroidota bacterium]